VAPRGPVYRFLTEESAPAFRGDPGWNVVKFLVNDKGEVINRFTSITKPMSETVTDAIEHALTLRDSKTDLR
jgi:glutathione peroxidase